MHPTVACLVRLSGQVAIGVVLTNTLSEKFLKAIALIQAKSLGVGNRGDRGRQQFMSFNMRFYMSFI